MFPALRRSLLLTPALSLILIAFSQSKAESADIDFKKTVLPILKNSCFSCHNNTSSTFPDVSPVILKKMNKEIGDAAEDFSMSDSFPFNNDDPVAKQIKHLEKELSKGFMPPDSQTKLGLGKPLSDKDRKTLLAWVAQEKRSLK